MTYPELYMMIDGERVTGGGRRAHAVVNPATGETLAALPLADAADLDRALDTARAGSDTGATPRLMSARPCSRAPRG